MLICLAGGISADARTHQLISLLATELESANDGTCYHNQLATPCNCSKRSFNVLAMKKE